MPYCDVIKTIRLYGEIPNAGYRDQIQDTFGSLKVDGKPYYFEINNDIVKINSYDIPVSKWQSWIREGVVVILNEEEKAMSNLPAVQQECAVVPMSPQEQISQASDMARLLKDVVNKAGLARKLGGKKEHLEFEAWQTIARWHHCTPSTEWTRPIKDGEKIIGWEARVNVIDDQGRVIGSSEGMCMADEQNWKGKPSYALRSMAQTRTAGKALRSLFAHIAVLAGYSPTPAEEMDGVTIDEGQKNPVPPPRQQATPKKETAIKPTREESGDKVSFGEMSPGQKKMLWAKAFSEFPSKEGNHAAGFLAWCLENQNAEAWDWKLLNDFLKDNYYQELANEYREINGIEKVDDDIPF